MLSWVVGNLATALIVFAYLAVWGNWDDFRTSPYAPLATMGVGFLLWGATFVSVVVDLKEEWELLETTKSTGADMAFSAVFAFNGLFWAGTGLTLHFGVHKDPDAWFAFGLWVVALHMVGTAALGYLVRPYWRRKELRRPEDKSQASPSQNIDRLQPTSTRRLTMRADDGPVSTDDDDDLPLDLVGKIDLRMELKIEDSESDSNSRTNEPPQAGPDRGAVPPKGGVRTTQPIGAQRREHSRTEALVSSTTPTTSPEVPCDDPGCSRCKPIRARIRGEEALAASELHYGKHASVLADIFPPETFRARLHQIVARCSKATPAAINCFGQTTHPLNASPSTTDWDLVVKECAALRDRMSRLVCQQEVWEAYRLREKTIDDPSFRRWLDGFVRDYLGDAHSVEVVRRRADDAKKVIAERADKARKVDRTMVDEESDRAVRRAREKRAEQQEAEDRAEAVKRVKDFDELTVLEKEKAIRAEMEKLRRERGEAPRG